jgi:hypothetical protein
MQFFVHIATFRSASFDRTAGASFDMGGRAVLHCLTVPTASGEGETPIVIPASNGFKDLCNPNTQFAPLWVKQRGRFSFSWMFE